MKGKIALPLLFFAWVLISLLPPSTCIAETYCQSVNRRGVANAGPLAKKMNEYLATKGIRYKTSPKEMTNTIRNYCKSNPHASADMVHAHLMNTVEVLAVLERK